MKGKTTPIFDLFGDLQKLLGGLTQLTPPSDGTGKRVGRKGAKRSVRIGLPNQVAPPGDVRKRVRARTPVRAQIRPPTL